MPSAIRKGVQCASDDEAVAVNASEGYQLFDRRRHRVVGRRAFDDLVPELLDERPELVLSVAHRPRPLVGALEHVERLSPFPARVQGEAVNAVRAQARRDPVWEKTPSPLEERDRGPMIHAPCRSLTCCSESRSGLERELGGVVAHRAPVRHGLLEVVADDLVELASLVEPARQPLVEVRTVVLRDRGVRRITDEGVLEQERVLAGLAIVGPHEAPPDERHQLRRGRCRVPRRSARRPRPA